MDLYDSVKTINNHPIGRAFFVPAVSGIAAYAVKAKYGTSFSRYPKSGLIYQLLAVSLMANGINYMTLDEDEFYKSLAYCTTAKVIGLAVSYNNKKIPFEVAFPISYMISNFFLG